MEKRIPVIFSMCHWHTLEFFKRWNIYRDSPVSKANITIQRLCPSGEMFPGFREAPR